MDFSSFLFVINISSHLFLNKFLKSMCFPFLLIFSIKQNQFFAMFYFRNVFINDFILPGFFLFYFLIFGCLTRSRYRSTSPPQFHPPLPVTVSPSFVVPALTVTPKAPPYIRTTCSWFFFFQFAFSTYGEAGSFH